MLLLFTVIPVTRKTSNCGSRNDFRKRRKPDEGTGTIRFWFAGIKCEDFLVPGQVVQLGPPNRIDLLNKVEGVEFESCYASRVEVMIEETNVSFIDLENLKKNKKAVGRFQDLADLENLN